MRGGLLPPSVIRHHLRTLRSLVDSKQGPDRAKRRPTTLLGTLHLGGSWSYVGPFFAIFSHFGGFVDASYAILLFGDAFFGFWLIFCRFGMDFGKILRWFFDGFSYFCQKSRFCQNRCFFYGKLLFSRISSLQKSIKNPSKIHANFVWEHKIKKNAQEMDLARSWAPFGRGLGRSGASFGRS